MLILHFLAFGVASWFKINANLYGSDAAICAMNIVPPGTQISIVNERNRHTARCTVIGTGPFFAGRILDVSPAVRDALGFEDLTTVRVYVIDDVLKWCKAHPQPQTCKAPPPAPCVLNLPKPAILECAK